MQLSFRWLTHMARMTSDPLNLAERLTQIGIEVESILDLGAVSGKIVIARVTAVSPIEETDHLSLCQVDAGPHGSLQVVCGAPNVREGMITVLALPGAILPGDKVIKQTKVHGVESNGMLCSGAEIKFNADASGVLELPADYPVGEPFDCFYDIKVTPNRADCLSVFGVARDIAALEGRELYPHQARLRETMDPISLSVQVTVKDKKACPRYACRMLRKVQVGESPVWLKRAIESFGLRPVNNVVDVTNYVLIEYGHPLHAFDLDRVLNRQVIVRKAEEGETMQLLDEREITLTAEDLLICDKERPIALAGVMGGANSEISSNTTTILLESAYFDPVCVRRTAGRHDLSTDASYRFERGTDYKQTIPSLNRATQLIAELTGAEVVKGAIDTGGSMPQTTPITVSIPRASMILETELTPSAIANKLIHLGFETVRSDREQLIVRPPTYRQDVTLDVDIIEEIARLHGYDYINESIPYLPAKPFTQPPLRTLRKAIRKAIERCGFWETINYSFTSRDLLSKCRAPLDKVVELLNPLNNDLAVMRTALIPSLVQNAITNTRHSNENLRLYEIAKVYERTDDPSEPYFEEYRLAYVMTGQIALDHWRDKSRAADFYYLKGITESVMNEIGIETITVDAEDLPSILHPGRGARVRVGDDVVGWIGILHPMAAQAMDFKDDILVAELRIERILEHVPDRKEYKAVGRYPKVSRDIALIVDHGTPAGQIQSIIQELGGELLDELHLFDVYEGDRMEAGKKSLAYAMTFRAPDRTLREEEIDEIQSRIVAALGQQYGAVLRDQTTAKN